MTARERLEDLKGRIERCQDRGDGMNWLAVSSEDSAAIGGVLTQIRSVIQTDRRVEDALRTELRTMTENQGEAIGLLTAAYNSGHREGWEPGPSTSETMGKILDWLCNHDADPTEEE